MMNNNFTPISLDELIAKEFTDNQWVIPGILPTGLSLLAGRPKQGKSILVANLALAVAHGLDTLQSSDYPCEPGATLLCALEDGEMRLQERLSLMLNELGITELGNLEIAFQIGLLPEALKNIESWYQRNEETAKLVIIDVFGRIRPQAPKSSGTLYDTEYKLLTPLQELAHKLNIGILLVHHTRKAISEENIYDGASGSTAMTAVPDTIVILESDGKNGTLHVRGRDIEEKSLSLEFDSENLIWRMTGNSSFQSQGPRQKEVVSILEENNAPMPISEIHKKLGGKQHATQQLLSRMKKADILSSPDRGIYQLQEQFPLGSELSENSIKLSNSQGLGLTTNDVSTCDVSEKLNNNSHSHITSLQGYKKNYGSKSKPSIVSVDYLTKSHQTVKRRSDQPGVEGDFPPLSVPHSRLGTPPENAGHVFPCIP